MRDRPTANALHWMAHRDPYTAAMLANFLRRKRFLSFNFPLEVTPDGRVTGAGNSRQDVFGDWVPFATDNRDMVLYVEA